MSILVLAFAPTVRDQVERAAYLRLRGTVGDKSVPGLLAAMRQLGKIRLDGAEASARFGDLVLAVRDRDDGDDSADQRVESALTALVGEPS